MAILKSSLRFAFDRASWAATLRLSWVALVVYACLSLYETWNPPPAEIEFGALDAVPWSAFALPFVMAAAMRVRVFGVGARLSAARWLSLGSWVLVWNLLLGAGVVLAGFAIAALLALFLALVPDTGRGAVIAFLGTVPGAALGIALAAAVLLGLVVAFVRLYLIIPAAAADQAVGARGAWRRARGNSLRLLLLAIIVLGLGDLVIGAAADGAAIALGSAGVNTALYNALALVTNQWAAAAWSDAHAALAREEDE